jgi:RNA polymerase sigma-70 factor (ECF subfamily)
MSSNPEKIGTPPRAADHLRADSTLSLLEKARGGDDDARARLFERCLPALRRWARGRLPPYARDLLDTHDLVQEAAIQTLKNLDGFESQHPGALNAYLREAVANRIKDQIRRVKRRPAPVSLDDAHPDGNRSPLDLAIAGQGIEAYEEALARLKPLDRAAIVSRLELQYSYEEVADALGKPTANAARQAVLRAIERLIAEMDRGGRS